jgi:4-hydroxybenzoate polyprenyltransferase
MNKFAKASSNQANRVNRYLSLVKFSHTLFAMPFALIGFFLARKTGSMVELDWQLLLYVILCMIFARNAAMAYNRYADREIDGSNPRTAQREIPAGKIRTRSALLFVVLNSTLFIATSFLINSLVFYLSPLALLVILGYSLTKRFTSLCHFVLGIGLSLAPIGAYLAVSEQFNLLPLLFSIIVLLWVSGFDIIYALQDDEFDISRSLESIPAKHGRKKALTLSLGLHIACIIGVIVTGMIGNFGWFYITGATLFSGFLVYQHTLVKPGDLSKVNMAFFTMNGMASLTFAFFTIVDIYRY